jgi:hypothetical protein
MRFHRERSDTPRDQTLKGSPIVEPFQGLLLFRRLSRGSLRSNPERELANAFSVFQIEPVPIGGLN